jgi:steroid 5-alpha reductase family enzyme
MFEHPHSIIEFLGLGCAVIIAIMTMLWGLSLKNRDASIVDRVWGLNFIALSLAYAYLTPEIYWRNLLVLTFVAIWGLRLSIHIHVRNRGKPEDVRYQDMRRRHGPAFWWQSLFRVFLLQGALSLIISAPILWVFYSEPDPNVYFVDALGILAWVVGFYFEAVGDLQLSRFKMSPTNKGKLLTTGLWSLSRHPNYFGDALQWWGLLFFALPFHGGYIAAIGPIIMTFFLRFVSGVTLLEGSLKVSKPGYENYTLETPAFIPKLHIMNFLRFLFLCGAKISINALYRFDVKEIGPWPEQPWKDMRIMILLNHTSLMEPMFGSQMPYSYLWRLSSRGNIPGAEETLKRAFVGPILKFVAPKVIGISRKYDDTWSRFLDSIAPKDTIIFMPEGRMKRPGGLDKKGNPMTVKRGVVDVLLKMKTGPMVFLYSGGLHHVQTPGEGFPKFFKKIEVGFEFTRIEDYLASFTKDGVEPIDRNESNETRPQGERRRDSTTSTVRSLFDRERSRSNFVTIYSLEGLQEAIIKDMEQRRDAHCGVDVQKTI